MALVARLHRRLNSEEYRQYSKEINVLDSEPFSIFKAARKEVMEAEGEDKIETWIKYKLQEPRFDNPYAQMPNLDLSKN